jgi:protein O-GlcNAc transferase
MSITLDNLKDKVNEVKTLYDEAQEELEKFQRVNNEKYVKCLQLANPIIVFLDSQNPFVINRVKEDVKTIYYINAETLTRTVGLHMNRPNGFTDQEKGVLYICVNHVQRVLAVDPFDPKSMELFKMICIFLTIFESDTKTNIKMLRNVLMVAPCDYQLHYNLGFMHQRDNNLEDAMYHLKLAIGLIDKDLNLEENKTEKNKDYILALKQFKVKCLNSLGGVYFAIQDRELANYYFYKALELLPNDPDIHNQIGVVYTELRFTDKAIYHYTEGIKNADNAHISQDKDMLLASMYMNMGLAYCYEINYPKAIESYNQALKYKPRLSLAYQNKLLDLNYISHLIEDPMYIVNLHKNINKIYAYVENDYKKSLPNYKVNKNILNAKVDSDGKIIKKGLKTKLKLGFISGDFICHPVSYFMHGLLKNINYDLFDIYCYSLKVVSIQDMFPKCKFKIVKGTSPEQLKQIIQDDQVDILFDLASQTGDNRLDTFVLKPAPIQISWIGYPNTSGLSNMDYHIIDRYTDSDGKTPGPGGLVRPSTQKYYTEKLLFMKNCFLNYIPSIGIDNLPELVKIQPASKNKYLTIGTFNRYNKINDSVVAVWEKMLERCPNVKFIIKTKEFLTPMLKEQFINAWKNKEILKRVTILHYSDTYTDHLVDYNLMDIALDTFPYSGTTTSAEALMMGVPCVTLFDSDRGYHCQCVTTSLMINTVGEKESTKYVAFTEEEYIQKIEYFSTHIEELTNLKKEIREKFVKSPICDYKGFASDFEDLMLKTYAEHSWN